MSPNVPALPHQLTSKRFMPANHSATRTTLTTPSRTSTAQANHRGTAPFTIMAPTPTRNSRRSAVGSSTLPSSDTWP